MKAARNQAAHSSTTGVTKAWNGAGLEGLDAISRDQKVSCSRSLNTSSGRMLLTVKAHAATPKLSTLF